MFDAFGTVTRKQWALYVSGLKLAENYPGIQGVGYAAVIDFDKLVNVSKAGFLTGYRVASDTDFLSKQTD